MVEMKEIKPNLLTRLKGFFLLHPIAVAVIAVIFAIMLFGGCEKARAEEYTDRSEYISDFLDTTAFSSSQKATILSYVPDYPYFFFAQASTGHSCIYLFKTNTGLLEYAQSNGQVCVQTSTGVRSSTMLPNADTALIDYYSFSVSPYNESCGNHIVYQSTNYPSGSIVYNYVNVTRVSGFSSNGVYVTPALYRCNIDTNFRISASYTTFSKNVDEIQYTADDRLKFAILDDASNGKTLMTDIRDFIADFPIHDTSHSSVYLDPESITLGYTVDGVAQTITLDSNNSSIRSKYIFETPLSSFGFNDSDDVVSITTCEFSIVGAAQGDPDLTTQTYKIACDYPLKRVANPIDKGNNQYANDVNGDTTSSEVTQSLNYLVTFREGYGLDFDEFSDIEFPDYYTYADVYLYNNQAAYSYLMDNIFSVNSVAYIIQNIANDEDDVITQIGLFLDDSNYGQYYDVIVFNWIQENSSSITHTYYYFETVSGRNKATTQIVRVLQEDVNNIKVNSAAIFTAVDNFESESLDFFNAKLAIDEDILGWLRTIDYSINGINIPEPDYSSILSRLDYIMDKLSIIANHSSLPSEDDTVSEAIAYFKSHSLNGFPIQSVFDENKLSIWMAGKVHSWLQGTDSQTTKTSLLNDAFDTLTSLYDALTNESDFFGNMEKYLGSLRGSFVQDLDGLYFSRFFQNSFDPDSYDGGSL